MSTRSSLAYDPVNHSFHFYTDIMDDNNVYLDIKGCCHCHAEQTISIPIHVWETIRHVQVEHFRYADLTDDQILEQVKTQVKERIEEYQKADEKHKGLWAFCGSLAFGSADDPEETQIASGVKYYSVHREREQAIKKKMADYKTYGTDGFGI